MKPKGASPHAATLSPGGEGNQSPARSNCPRAVEAGGGWMNDDQPDELFERGEFSSGRHSSVRRREPAKGGQDGRGFHAI